METGNIAKPATATVHLGPPRADHLASAGAVKTELAPEAAVQQAAKTQAVRFQPSEGAASRAATEASMRGFLKHNLTSHSETSDVEFQLDERVTAAVRQLPKEAVSKLRAYAKKLRDADSADSHKRVEKIV